MAIVCISLTLNTAKGVLIQCRAALLVTWQSHGDAHLRSWTGVFPFFLIACCGSLQVFSAVVGIKGAGKEGQLISDIFGYICAAVTHCINI